MKPLRFGLDWDDTYTADRDLWNAFIVKAQEKGHSVVIVTCRNKDWVESDAEMMHFHLPVFYTDFAPKRQYMEDQGVHIDIWIDDTPESVKDGR